MDPCSLSLTWKGPPKQMELCWECWGLNFVPGPNPTHNPVFHFKPKLKTQNQVIKFEVDYSQSSCRSRWHSTLKYSLTLKYSSTSTSFSKIWLIRLLAKFDVSYDWLCHLVWKPNKIRTLIIFDVYLTLCYFWKGLLLCFFHSLTLTMDSSSKDHIATCDQSYKVDILSCTNLMLYLSKTGNQTCFDISPGRCMWSGTKTVHATIV